LSNAKVPWTALVAALPGEDFPAVEYELELVG
jgi:hypothetical protein